MNEHHFDVAIIGSGIAGSSLAAILARHGQRVIVFEAKSLILETSEIMRALAWDPAHNGRFFRLLEHLLDLLLVGWLVLQRKVTGKQHS